MLSNSGTAIIKKGEYGTIVKHGVHNVKSYSLSAVVLPPNVIISLRGLLYEDMLIIFFLNTLAPEEPAPEDIEVDWWVSDQA